MYKYSRFIDLEALHAGFLDVIPTGGRFRALTPQHDRMSIIAADGSTSRRHVRRALSRHSFTDPSERLCGTQQYQYLVCTSWSSLNEVVDSPHYLLIVSSFREVSSNFPWRSGLGLGLVFKVKMISTVFL